MSAPLFFARGMISPQPHLLAKDSIPRAPVRLNLRMRRTERLSPRPSAQYYIKYVAEEHNSPRGGKWQHLLGTCRKERNIAKRAEFPLRILL